MLVTRMMHAHHTKVITLCDVSGESSTHHCRGDTSTVIVIAIIPGIIIVVIIIIIIVVIIDITGDQWRAVPELDGSSTSRCQAREPHVQVPSQHH